MIEEGCTRSLADAVLNIASSEMNFGGQQGFKIHNRGGGGWSKKLGFGRGVEYEFSEEALVTAANLTDKTDVTV